MRVPTRDFTLSYAKRDRSWDSFVDVAPGGQHVQSSAWAEVKAGVGWRSVRVLLGSEGAVTGGCQVLLKKIPLVGSVAYCPRGPLLPDSDMAPLAAVLTGVDALARRERVVFVKMQPPAGQERMEAALVTYGYRPSELEAAPTATVRVVLDQPTEDLWRAMRSGTRSNVGKARRKGVTVRVGGVDDMPVFYDLVRRTGERQGFSPYPLSYYAGMLRAFESEGRSRLLLAEFEERPLAALLLLAYGDTVTYVMGGWSGERTSVHPTELAHWTAIEWAKSAAYRYYDFGGVDPAFARAFLDGEVRREDAKGVAYFKVGFGGEVIMLPPAFDRRYRRVTAAAMHVVASQLPRSSVIVRRGLGRLG